MTFRKCTLVLLLLLAPGFWMNALAETIEIHPYSEYFFTDAVEFGEVKNEGIYGIKGGVLVQGPVLLDPLTAQGFWRPGPLSVRSSFRRGHGAIQNLFRAGRHHLKAIHNRLLLDRAFADWREATCAC